MDTRRRHVLRDLQPYVCTYADCDLLEHFFASRSEWYSHEMQCHRVEWFCNIKGHPQYTEKHDFLEHMKSSHYTTFNIDQESKVLGMFKLPSRTPYGKCNLCSRPDVKIKSHVARHLEQMALFALPRSNEAAGHGSEGLDSTAGVDGKLQAKDSLGESSAPNESGKSRDNPEESGSKLEGPEDGQEPQVDEQGLDEDIEQIEVPDSEFPTWDRSLDQVLQTIEDDLKDDASIRSSLHNCNYLLQMVRTGVELNEYYYLLETLKNLDLALRKLQLRCTEAELDGERWYRDLDILVTPDGTLGRLQNKYRLLFMILVKTRDTESRSSFKWLDENVLSKFQPFLRRLIDLDAEIESIAQDPTVLARSVASSRAKETPTQPKAVEDDEVNLKGRLADANPSVQPVELMPKDLLWIPDPEGLPLTADKYQGSSWNHKAHRYRVSFPFSTFTFENLDVPMIELTTLQTTPTGSSASITVLALDIAAFIYEAVYDPSDRAEAALAKRGREEAYRLHCVMDMAEAPTRCHAIYVDSSTRRMRNGEKKGFFLIVERLRAWSNECRRVGVACSAEEGDLHVNMVTTSRPEFGLVRIL